MHVPCAGPTSSPRNLATLSGSGSRLRSRRPTRRCVCTGAQHLAGASADAVDVEQPARHGQTPQLGLLPTHSLGTVLRPGSCHAIKAAWMHCSGYQGSSGLRALHVTDHALAGGHGWQACSGQVQRGPDRSVAQAQLDRCYRHRRAGESTYRGSSPSVMARSVSVSCVRRLSWLCSRRLAAAGNGSVQHACPAAS